MRQSLYFWETIIGAAFHRVIREERIRKKRRPTAVSHSCVERGAKTDIVQYNQKTSPQIARETGKGDAGIFEPLCAKN